MHNSHPLHVSVSTTIAPLTFAISLILYVNKYSLLYYSQKLRAISDKKYDFCQLIIFFSTASALKSFNIKTIKI